MRIRSLAPSCQLGPLLAGLLLFAAPAQAGSLYCTDSTIPNTVVEWVPGPNLPNVSPDCLGAFFCRQPTAQAPVFEVLPPGCDANTSACTLRVRVALEMPGLHQELTLFKPGQIYWFANATPTVPCTPPGLPNPSCNPAPISTCGILGTAIDEDRGETYLELPGVQCANLSDTRFRAYSISAYRCKGATGCERRRDVSNIDLSGTALANRLGCKLPPTDTCNTGECRTCLDGGVSVAGNGAGLGPSGDMARGRGAELLYQAGGVGGDGFPGSAAWRLNLGRYWSHDYAERIVVDPNDSHVWLLTRWGVFREFSGLTAGVYTINSPSDEYRTLRRTAGGWELEELDGLVHSFDNAGLWLASTDRFGNAKTAIYTGGALTAVSFPDGRSEAFTYHPTGKLAAITEVGVAGAATRAWGYTWVDDDLVRVDLPDGQAMELFYEDPALPGYLTRVERVGALGGRRVEQAWEYDARGNAVATWKGDVLKTGPNAVELWQLAFDNPVLPAVATVTDPLGATSTYTIGRDTGSRKPKLLQLSGSCPACGLGPNTQLAYNASGHPLLPSRITDARGNRTDFTFDANGQVLTRTEASTTALQRTTTWTYNPTFPALRTTETRPSTSGGSAERETTWIYNASGALTEERIEGIEAPGGAFSYSTIHTPTAQGQTDTTDPPGHGTADQTSWTYDPARGSLLPDTRTDPLIGTTVFAYDPFNRRTSMTDVNGVVTETAYDELDRVTEVRQRGAIPAEDLVTTHEYTELGDLLRTTLPRGNVIQYAYDPAARLIAIERRPDAATLAERTFYTLDELGNRTKEELQRWTGSSWETRSFTDFLYANRCQLQAVVNPDGSRTEYGFDCAGNLDRVWDANHPSAGQTAIPTTQYSYDALDRLTSVIQRWGGTGGGFATTSYGYDVQDHLASVTDAEGTVTTYQTSDRDLLTQETSLVSGTTLHAYDDHGELVETMDARGILTVRTPDALDRVTLVDYPGTGLDVTYTYDDALVPFSKGRLTAITRNGASIDYTFDRFGRVLRDGELVYAYDANGNRSSIEYSGGVVATYTHDFENRELSLTVSRPSLPDLLVASAATYEPSGPLKTLALGNGTTETRSYTTRYFPQQIELAGQQVTFSSTYTTDFEGNPTGVSDDTIPANNRTYGYQDFQYFLTSGVGAWGNLAWSYDKIGNRLTETRGGLTDTYTYQPNGSGGRTAILQQINLGVGGTRDYQHGPAGHLELVTAGANQVDFITDAAGRLSRLERAAGDAAADFRYEGRSYLSSSQAGTVTLFADGFESGDTRCWSETIGAPNAPENCSPQPETFPVYSSEGLLHALHRNPGQESEARRSTFYFAGRPMAELDRPPTGAETWRWLTTDHLGTPVLATSSAGLEVWRGGFEPFGQDFSGASASGVDLRLPGQWEDETWRGAGMGAEVLFNLLRWYLPATGRFTKADPLGLAGGVNPYSYVAANPIAWIDRTGLERGGFRTPTTAEIEKARQRSCARMAFYRNYRGMIEANWKRSDKYFHCKANCEASRCGSHGHEAACELSDLREFADQLFKGDPASASAADQEANLYGRDQARAKPDKSCQVVCQKFRPYGLPEKY